MTYYICGVGTAGGKVENEFLKTNIARGVWIDADKDAPKKKGLEKIKKSMGYTQGYYIFTEDIQHLEPKILKETGHGIDTGGIESGGGYGARPELPMTAYTVEGVKEKMSENVMEIIKRAGCDVILFTVVFGGGTGTGIINPIADIWREEKETPCYALGVLTETKTKTLRPEIVVGRRCFNNAWALYDLLSAMRGVHAVFLADNDKIEGDGDEKNRRIAESFSLMIDTRRLDDLTEIDLKTIIGEGMNMPPTIVPCYLSGESAEDLFKKGVNVSGVLDKGKLMNCDHTKADRVYVFTSFIEKEKDEIEEQIRTKIGVEEKVKVDAWRVLGNPNKKEVLILFRNPYGGGEEDSFVKRISEIIDNAIKYAKPNGITDGDVNRDIVDENFTDDYKKYLKNLIDKELIPNWT